MEGDRVHREGQLGAEAGLLARDDVTGEEAIRE